ncbi:MAG: glycosyltransferase family 4 protein [Candidatus Portnoybacteria bacterium]|nr:glycosyltransferase family 4 protein [Candidatus Portnoybacteria bacterium]
MKINFLLPHLKISGGVRVILTYANLLAKNGHEVRVIVKSRNWTRSLFNFLAIKPRWFGKLAAKVVRVGDFTPENIPDADILVADSWKPALALSFFPLSKGKKFHFVQHDERLYHGNADEVSVAYKLPMEKIVVSSWLKEMLARDFGVNAHLLLNTVDRGIFFPVEGLRKRDKIRILILHHNYEWKGSREGIQLARELKNKYPSVELVVFGARVKKIDLPTDEYYYQPKNRTRLFSSCDIFLCPSWDEGFGLPSLEAMACRCAVVTYDNGGSRDFAFEGQTALVAERKNKEDLRVKLEALILDQKLREKISQGGRDFVLKLPTWDEQAEKLEKIFQTSLN